MGETSTSSVSSSLEPASLPNLAKGTGHGRDQHEQRVIIARSKLLRELPTVATWWGSSSVAMEF